MSPCRRLRRRRGAALRAAALGYAPLILSTGLVGESCEVGKCLAAIAREVALYRRPAAPPCALIAGGENTVTLSGPVGTGGPSQELAASLAASLDGLGPVAALCLDTDGSDGPTPYAGGLVDSLSASYARGQGLDVTAALRRHDAASLLTAIGDAVITGATGTNVADLVVILVEAEGA